jgi:hypothetical protein
MPSRDSIPSLVPRDLKVALVVHNSDQDAVGCVKHGALLLT